MTTAHKPTWTPAVGASTGDMMMQGNYRGAVSHQFSARDMPSHLKIKMRKHGQSTQAEIRGKDLRRELEEREQKHFAGKGSGHAAKRRGVAQITDSAHRKKRRQKLLTNQAGTGKRRARKKKRPTTKKADGEFDDSDDTASSSEDDKSSSGSDSDDEEALLLELELQKIKKERAEERRAQAAEEAKRKADEKAESILKGNPLMDPSKPLNAPGRSVVTRRWDDDVVFKNQARDEPKLKKRFVNDTIRNDFHRRFLTKYIQ